MEDISGNRNRFFDTLSTVSFGVWYTALRLSLVHGIPIMVVASTPILPNSPASVPPVNTAIGCLWVLTPKSLAISTNLSAKLSLNLTLLLISLVKKNNSFSSYKHSIFNKYVLVWSSSSLCFLTKALAPLNPSSSASNEANIILVCFSSFWFLLNCSNI